jgi:Cu/Ag efflux protein CusF
MRKALVFVLATAFLVSGASFAMAQSSQSSSQQGSMKSIRGTISSVDKTAKSFVVKDADGKEVTIFWTDATSLSGELTEGASVNLQTTQQDGKTVATAIQVSSSKKAY